MNELKRYIAIVTHLSGREYYVSCRLSDFMVADLGLMKSCEAVLRSKMNYDRIASESFDWESLKVFDDIGNQLGGKAAE